jgi:inosine/xanthosine triphosphate pyrophosphatase family protein
VGALARSAVFASRNPNKARELEQLLPGWHVEPLTGGTFPPETGTSYYENARGKAVYGRSLEKRPLWVIGEDRMLAALAGIEGEGRRARYISELVAIPPDGEELRGSGALLGRIGHQPRGSEGFGYDPIFLPEDEERTVAELGNAWKRSNSHRARAARALLEVLGA